MDWPVERRAVVIQNLEGLHARPAQLLARLAMQFESTIELVREKHRVDAKSILHLLTLGAAQGTELLIEAQGSDAEAALDAIARLVESQFAADEPMSQQSPH
jgi:phosphotransferase system HPr (HPr) family protein